MNQMHLQDVPAAKSQTVIGRNTNPRGESKKIIQKLD